MRFRNVNYFFYCIIMKFKLFQINLGEIMYFNEIIVKNCTYLIRQSTFPLHRCKNMFSCFVI